MVTLNKDAPHFFPQPPAFPQLPAFSKIELPKIELPKIGAPPFPPKIETPPFPPKIEPLTFPLKIGAPPFPPKIENPPYITVPPPPPAAFIKKAAPPLKKVAPKRCGGKWTEARFKQFIISQIRGATRKWDPKIQAKKLAWRKRGLYECNMCHNLVPPTIPSAKGGRRLANVLVDHINPIVDPCRGFTSWDEYIERTFCELEGFQVLCRACHSQKTAEERQIRTSSRKIVEFEEEEDDDNHSIFEEE